MASISYVESKLSALPAQFRGGVAEAFRHVLDSWRVGRCAHQTRAENAQLYALAGTTHATPDTEFSIEHGLPRAPYVAIPVLALEVNQQLVPLTCTRAPDSVRIYLSSSVASAPFRVLVEA